MPTNKTRDRYGFPVAASNRYRVTPPGRPSLFVEVYWNGESILMCCDLKKKVGDDYRFFSVGSVHPHASWSRINLEHVDIEPDNQNRDSDGKIKETVFDLLCELEKRAYLLKAEQRRLEGLACQVMGVWIADGSNIAEAAFELIYNASTAERCMDAYHECLRRLEKASR